MAVPLLVANVTPTAPALPPVRVTVIVAVPPFSATLYVAALNCNVPGEGAPVEVTCMILATDGTPLPFRMNSI